jgi:FKBP-type peptidyl-prolyl cis-trans isomerase FkpA
MKPGGKSTLLIPSKLAYGASGTYGIPGYTPLLFDIELVKTVPHTGQ